MQFQDPTGREVLCGSGTGGMYLLGTLVDMNKSPSALVTKSVETHQVWHCCFGHTSVKTIKIALAKNLVDGLELKGDLNVSGICEDCIYGKHTSCPYNAKVMLEGVPNEHVHIDL